MRRFARHAPTALILLVLWPATALAQTQSFYNWTAPNDAVWGVPGNWQSGTVPNVAGASITFGGSSPRHQLVTVDGAYTAGQLIFDTNQSIATTHQYGRLLTGGSLTLWNAAGVNPEIRVTTGGVRVETPLTVAGTGTLVLANGDTTGYLGELDVAGVIGGAANLDINRSAFTGTVVVSGNNTYTGTTLVSGGALRANDGQGLSAASALTLRGAVLEGSGPTTFTRSLGTGAGQVGWYNQGGFVASGGFSARDGTTTVRLNNGTGNITWNGFNPFASVNASLMLGSSTANALTDFQNGLVLPNDSIARNVSVADSLTSGRDYARVSGVISGSGSSFNKTGNGTLELTAANTYTGFTFLNGGALRARGGVGLPGNSTLLLGGSTSGAFLPGVLEGNGPTTFTRTVGGRVQWSAGGSGGFSAYNGTMTVRLNNNANAVTWGSGGFVSGSNALAFGSATADSLTDFQNAINLNGSAGTFYVYDNPFRGGDYARLFGVLSNGAVTKTGTGTLELSAANTYTGTTQVQNGAVRANDGAGLPAASNLLFVGGASTPGGVLEGIGNVTFTRAIGTGAGQVRWSGAGSPGGFSASGGTMTVRLNNGTAAVNFGSTNFVLNGSYLRLNSTTATGLVDVQNDINLVTTGGFLVQDNLYSGTDYARLSGVVGNGGAGAGNLNKRGSGTLELTGANTYTGSTVIEGGALRAADGVGLPSASNLAFSGTLYTTQTDRGLGVFEGSGPTTFTRSLGTSAGRVQWFTSSSGGFSAFGGTMTVRLNNSAAAVTWGSNFSSGGFVPGGQALVFGSATADSLTDFQNAINLNNGDRSFYVIDNPNAGGDYARLSGVLSNGGLIKDGLGTLELTAANTYTGRTTLAAGALRAADGVGLPGDSPLVFARSNAVPAVVSNPNHDLGFYLESPLAEGGVLESPGTATFTRSLGGGAGQVRWANGGGGFAAGAGTFTIQINGGNGQLIWGQPDFVRDGKPLIFGSSTATGLVDFQNAIDLGGRNRVVAVADNPNAGGDYARLSGVLSNGGLIKDGAGTLELAAANTYAGPTVVRGGVLRVSGALASSSVTVEAGGTLGGVGPVAGPVAVGAGGGVSPGGSVGTLAVAGVTLGGGSTFVFEVGDAAGAPGTGWDKLEGSGALTLAGTAANPVVFRLVSLGEDGNPGAASNFNPAQGYQWTLATFSEGVTGFTRPEPTPSTRPRSPTRRAAVCSP